MISEWNHHFLHTKINGSERYRAAIAKCSDEISALFETIKRPYSGINPGDLRQQVFDIPLSASSVVSIETAIQEVADVIAQNSIIVQHPHCIAHLHTPPAIPGIVAEAFISTMNQSMDSWDQSGASTFVEQHVVKALCNMFGFTANADGVFTSGGTQSNIMALLIARDWFVSKYSGHNVQRHGLPEYAGKLRIICSAKSHFTVEKAAAIMGLGQDAVVRIPTHTDGSIVVEQLVSIIEGVISDGLLPFAIVGTAGTTDHGAVDELARMSGIATQRGIWFHVDAAYGGALVLSKSRHRLSGIELANSVTVDFHKLWFQPISCGVILLRDGSDFKHLLYRADYLNRETDDLPNLVDKTISTTRRFDALKMFITLRTIGTEILGEMIDHLLLQTKSVADLIDKSQDFELLAEPTLTTVLFRCRSTIPLVDSDSFNRRLRLTLLKSGVCVLGETTLEGRAALKLTILNPCLSMSNFESLFSNIRRVAQTMGALNLSS